MSLAPSYFGKAAPCSLKPIYVHSSEKLPAVNLTRQHPRICWRYRIYCCVVLCFPKAIGFISIHIHQHSLSPNQCMWSIVVVTAMVASTVTSVQPGDYKPQTFLYFPKLSTWLCSLMGVPVITGSPTVPVITFIKFCFWKTKQKKNHCLDMFFYISKPILF